MFAIIEPIKKRISTYLKYQEIKTENVVFRLHCLLTALVLAVASILLTSTQLIGDPIQCFSSDSRSDKWHNAINTFCWVTTTFTMPDFATREKHGLRPHPFLSMAESISYEAAAASEPRLFGLHEVDTRVVAPGVGNEYEAEGGKKYYSYYQWVCFVLFFQAIMCFVPKMLWDYCEGGLLARLATGMHGYCPTEEREKKSSSIVCYLLRYRQSHRSYALLQWGCEFLCLINVLVQMWLMNSFLGGGFWSFGSLVMKNSHLPQHQRFDPVIYMFPRMTKCTFYYFGPSGGIVNLDSLCVLPQNVINEKIYVFLWFWYILLGALLFVLTVYRMCMVLMPTIRPKLILLRSRTTNMELITSTSQKLDFGDWWLLYMLAKNIHPLVFKELLIEFARKSNKSNLYPHISAKELEALGLSQT